MATMTEEEWETLRAGLDTSAILESVDAVDRLRQALSGMDGGNSPAIRDDLLKLHQLGLAVKQRAPQTWWPSSLTKRATSTSRSAN